MVCWNNFALHLLPFIFPVIRVCLVNQIFMGIMAKTEGTSCQEESSEARTRVA